MAEYYNLTLHHIQCDKSGSVTDVEAPLVVIREVTPLMQKSVLPNLERSVLLDGMWSILKGHWLEERKNKT
ncbi:MAG: hypothetical protein IJ175_05395 [Clostridia bacterium]|nr:hypothetical protein [Clostridia bacterium]MBQ8129665.1 hypothetical protein [Clostridia bacterium]